MGAGLSTDNATIVSAFHQALVHQLLIVLVIVAIVGVSWNLLRATLLRRAAAGGATTPAACFGTLGAEPVARRLLRVCFGLIWIFDGILQGQASMPLGMAPQVIQPAAATSPSWVQHLVNDMATTWSYHPIAVPAAAVWIQVGVGLFMLVAPRGIWSRLTGLAGVGWGLIVWVFGEAFGSIFAPGLSWMFGAPGAVLFYCFAGVLIALPDRSWTTPRLGRVILAVIGLFFVGMAVLQAWPGRGFWQGQVRGDAIPGQLTTMVQQMAQTPQPRFLSSLLSSFAVLDAAHGWAVNLFVVIALAAIGLAFLVGRPPVVRFAVIGGVVLCLADWVLVEDFGFFGGVGTDPNSMIPMALVFVAGYLAITRLPVVASDAVVPIVAPTAAGHHWRERLTTNPTYAFRSIAAIGAIAITLVGAAPMAVAAMNPRADPILAEATDGTPDTTNFPAPGFDLEDQYGNQVTLSSLSKKVVALTFLDPVCTSDCPVIAQEFRAADEALGASSGDVMFIAVVANPLYRSITVTQAFDRAEGLSKLNNWLYLTGSVAALTKTWDNYGVQVGVAAAGSMVAHTELAYVITRGRTRYVLDADPGPATQATESSFSNVLESSIDHLLAGS
jgi:cytochrome oxidase Cu insertion factor (SCO1/SenC/PrrC family)